MKTISVAQAVEKARIDSDVPFLMLLNIHVYDPRLDKNVVTMHAACNNEDVVYQGKTYTKGKFDIKVKAESGAIPTISLSVVDYDGAIQRIVDPYDGGVGSTVELIIISADALDEPPEMTQPFEVVSGSSSGHTIGWELGAENALTRMFPKRRQLRDRCAWRFKSPECGYTGPLTSCDLSLNGPNGCAKHHNTRRFGGFPGLR